MKYLLASVRVGGGFPVRKMFMELQKRSSRCFLGRAKSRPLKRSQPPFVTQQVGEGFMAVPTNTNISCLYVMYYIPNHMWHPDMII